MVQLTILTWTLTMMVSLMQLKALFDTDTDGKANYVDDDSDGDGISDVIEGVTDTDGDGVIDSQDGY